MSQSINECLNIFRDALNVGLEAALTPLKSSSPQEKDLMVANLAKLLLHRAIVTYYSFYSDDDTLSELEQTALRLLTDIHEDKIYTELSGITGKSPNNRT